MDAAAKTLAKRYARAYMDLRGAYSAAAGKAAEAKLEGLRLVFEVARPHMKALTHPAVNAAVKLEVLARLLQKQEGPAVKFAALLVKAGRFGLLEDVMAECLRLNDEFCGVVRAEVYSRYQLSEGGVKRGTALLEGALGKKVALRQVIAERVIGGFEVKVGDILIDATVRGRLDKLKSDLKSR